MSGNGTALWFSLLAKDWGAGEAANHRGFMLQSRPTHVKEIVA
jgi:hypothetical protein